MSVPEKKPGSEYTFLRTLPDGRNTPRKTHSRPGFRTPAIAKCARFPRLLPAASCCGLIHSQAHLADFSHGGAAAATHMPLAAPLPTHHALQSNLSGWPMSFG